MFYPDLKAWMIFWSGRTKAKSPNLAFICSGTSINSQTSHGTTSCIFSWLLLWSQMLWVFHSWYAQGTSLPTQNLCWSPPTPHSGWASFLWNKLSRVSVPFLQGTTLSKYTFLLSTVWSLTISCTGQILFPKDEGPSLNHNHLTKCLVCNSCSINTCGKKKGKEQKKQNNRVPFWNIRNPYSTRLTHHQHHLT